MTDVIFERAGQWIETQHQQGEPFFAYIATNAPHGPFHDVPEDLRAEYAAMDLGNDQFPQGPGWPLPDTANLDRRARVFAMITNIDDNVGRLFDRLEALGIADDTLVMFLVDNGPNFRRHLAGMRGRKSDVYEGGVRSPLFVHWPARLTAGASSDRVAAHIDVMPTLLDAAGVDVPDDLQLDGRSFLPLLTSDDDAWPHRNLVIQTHRGDAPVRYHHFMLRDARWKLVHPSGFGRETFEGPPRFELYDMDADPLELVDVAAEHPDVVQRLVAAYDGWFDDVGSTRPDNYLPPRIVVGSPLESPTVLTRQDWRHEQGQPWGANSNGYWELDVATAGAYDIDVRFPRTDVAGTLTLRLDDQRQEFPVAAGVQSTRLEDVTMPRGPVRLRIALDLGDISRGPRQADLTLDEG